MLISLTFFGCFKAYKLPTEGMSTTLKRGDWFIATPIGSKIERGDIVIFKYPKDQSQIFVSRVIGLPNEKIEVHGSKVFINGQALVEPYILPENNQGKLKSGAWQTGNDEFFVLGDNRDNSMDSRYWGNLKRDLITEKHRITYYHLDEEPTE